MPIFFLIILNCVLFEKKIDKRFTPTSRVWSLLDFVLKLSFFFFTFKSSISLEFFVYVYVVCFTS